MSDERTAMASPLEAAVIGGDLARLTEAQRVAYYKAVCESLGLNPLTRPFDYITLNGRLTLYARKDCTDQLRRLHNVSIDDVGLEDTPTHFIVKVKGRDKAGRADVEIGVVAKSEMAGNLGNAQMKAVTKAKRRLTLSLCGLGMLDETEVEDLSISAGAQRPAAATLIDRTNWATPVSFTPLNERVPVPPLPPEERLREAETSVPTPPAVPAQAPVQMNSLEERAPVPSDQSDVRVRVQAPTPPPTPAEPITHSDNRLHAETIPSTSNVPVPTPVPSNQVLPRSKEELLRQAEDVLGADGRRYGDCASAELEGKRLGLLRALSRPTVSAELQAQYQLKLAAATRILNARAQSVEKKAP